MTSVAVDVVSAQRENTGQSAGQNPGQGPGQGPGQNPGHDAAQNPGHSAVHNTAKIGVVLLGTGLGYSLSRIGFTDGRELHRMFTFADWRMFLVFMGGVALTAVGLVATGRWRGLPRRSIHRGSIVGGVLFGVGWVVAGACPGVVFAQLGEGKAWALISLAGMAAGVSIFAIVNRRLKLDRGDACG